MNIKKCLTLSLSLSFLVPGACWAVTCQGTVVGIDKAFGNSCVHCHPTSSGPNNCTFYNLYNCCNNGDCVDSNGHMKYCKVPHHIQ